MADTNGSVDIAQDSGTVIGIVVSEPESVDGHTRVQVQV